MGPGPTLAGEHRAKLLESAAGAARRAGERRGGDRHLNADAPGCGKAARARRARPPTPFRWLSRLQNLLQPPLAAALTRDPFQQFTDAELLNWGLSAPMDFAPGTNWGYSHTNYVILGQVLAKVAGKPLDQVLQQYVLDPMGLTQTSANGNTPAIPEPVMHVFSSERKEALGIPVATPFSEESTFWNPSWTTATGAVETTTIDDMTRSMEIVGSGSQVSPAMYKAQTGNSLLGFGHKDPTGRCSVCGPLTPQRSYGLGVVLIGPWILQAKSFAGSAAVAAYLPSHHLAISVVTTYLPEAYDDKGNYVDASRPVFLSIANALAAGSTP